MDHGHPFARQYPLGMVWDEAALVTSRLNALEATRGVILQMAVSSLFSNEAQRLFSEELARLNEG